MDRTASSEAYSGESVPTYGQTESQSQHGELPNEELPHHNVKREPPKAAWKYHNLDSGLLEFLCFLAEHEVVVAKNDELSKDENFESESGSSMQVFRGRWKDCPVILKYPVDDKMPLKNAAEDSPEYGRRLKAYRKLQKDLMFEIQIMAHSHLNQHRNIVKLLAVAFESFLTTFECTDSNGNNVIEEIFLPILIIEPAMVMSPTLKHYFELHSNEAIPIDLAVSFICDIAAGLAAAHLYGIIHGDVKDANVLLFQETVDGRDKIVAKIADFGASGIETSREDIRGLSFDWAAPEILNRPRGWSGLRHTPAADIYSFGLLVAMIALNGQKVFAEDVEGYDMKMKDEAHIHIKQRLEEHLRRSTCTGSHDMEAYIKALKALIDSTVRLNPSDRWPDLSFIPHMLGKETDSEYSRHKLTMIPFHNYGTEAHPGVESLAPFIVDNIYGKLPIAIKQRLAYHIDRFRHASTDSQTLLVHLALKMKEDPSILESSDDLVRQLLALRLSQKSPGRTTTSLEVDPLDIGGFSQMYLQEVVVNTIVEPTALKSVREGKLHEIKEMIAKDSKVRQSSIGTGWNGLHYAAYFCRPEFIGLFLQEPYALGINEVGGNTHRYTPLHTAARESNVECVKELLRHGADVNVRSMTAGDFSFTPLQFCLLSLGSRVDLQMVLETVKLLLGAGSSTTFRFKGQGITHFLAQQKDGGALLSVVLKHHPQLIDQMTPSKQTPLHSAAGVRNLAAVKVLLSFGAAVDARNIVGDTPLHNAYMSIGPSTRLTSERYQEDYVQKLLGGVEDAEEVIRLLIEAGADQDALGIDDLPWDTPEFRMYHEYEDASTMIISPAAHFAEAPDSIPVSWALKEWNESGTGVCATFTPGEEKLDLYYDLGSVTPNYYETKIRLAVLGRPLSSLSVTLLIYRDVEPDSAEVYMSARLSLHQLEINKIWTIKLRDFIIKHRMDLKIHIYQELNPGFGQEHPKEGKILLDWISIGKFDISTVVGDSNVASIDGI